MQFYCTRGLGVLEGVSCSGWDDEKNRVCRRAAHPTDWAVGDGARWVWVMSNYRRSRLAGGYFFFTVVTHERRGILVDEPGRACLKEVWQAVQERRPFDVVALCLLPEHIHCVWKLPKDDADYAKRWSLIKGGFTRRYIAQGGAEAKQSESRREHRFRGIWQKRFWEHRIRNENDLQRHVDYIHYNPVKHGHVDDAHSWRWSTIHQERWRDRYRRFDWSGVSALGEGYAVMD